MFEGVFQVKFVSLRSTDAEGYKPRHARPKRSVFRELMDYPGVFEAARRRASDSRAHLPGETEIDRIDSAARAGRLEAEVVDPEVLEKELGGMEWDRQRPTMSGSIRKLFSQLRM